MPSNSKTLWDAVRKVKDLNTESIPKTMFKDIIFLYCKIKFYFEINKGSSVAERSKVLYTGSRGRGFEPP